jgi:hypothetical protein
MIKKYINLSILLFLFTFIFLVSKHYFSDKNIILTNKSRSSYSLNPTIDLRNLPLLKNDTDNIIVYINDIEEFKKKRKKRAWEELILNTDE